MTESIAQRGSEAEERVLDLSPFEVELEDGAVAKGMSMALESGDVYIIAEFPTSLGCDGRRMVTCCSPSYDEIRKMWQLLTDRDLEAQSYGHEGRAA